MVTMGAKATASETHFWPKAEAEPEEIKPRVATCTCNAPRHFVIQTVLSAVLLQAAVIM